MEFDEELTEQEVVALERENEKIFQAANEGTLRAMWITQMVAPAVEEVAFDFKAKKAALNR